METSVINLAPIHTRQYCMSHRTVDNCDRSICHVGNVCDKFILWKILVAIYGGKFFGAKKNRNPSQRYLI